MIYHTVVNEVVGPMGLTAQHSTAAPSLEDLYCLYRQVFDASGSSTSKPVVELMQVVMAAQEPLSMSLLQQMGLDSALWQLPGYGVLFFVAEHHLYMMHKSLSDWLVGQPFIDVSQGHLALGLHLAHQDLGRPTPYMLKYMATHLAVAGQGQAYQELDNNVLQNFGFIEEICLQGLKHHLVSALAKVPRSDRSPLVSDMLRWLTIYSEEVKAAGDMARTALYCPVATRLYKVAEAKLKGQLGGWVTRDAWYHRDWTACKMVLKVRCDAGAWGAGMSGIVLRHHVIMSHVRMEWNHVGKLSV